MFWPVDWLLEFHSAKYWQQSNKERKKSVRSFEEPAFNFELWGSIIWAAYSPWGPQACWSRSQLSSNVLGKFLKFLVIFASLTVTCIFGCMVMLLNVRRSSCCCEVLWTIYVRPVWLVDELFLFFLNGYVAVFGYPSIHTIGLQSLVCSIFSLVAFLLYVFRFGMVSSVCMMPHNLVWTSLCALANKKDVQSLSAGRPRPRSRLLLIVFAWFTDFCCFLDATLSKL